VKQPTLSLEPISLPRRLRCTATVQPKGSCARAKLVFPAKPPPRTMPAPLAKGIIIAASVLVAAGIAIYENPQVRQWVDQSRRKIAVALHSLGDDVQPRRSGELCDDAEDARQRRRNELIRRNRNELVRRAREEGVAVDLDELARIGDEAADAGRKRQARGDRPKSFDEIVGNDGTLKGDGNATVDTDATTATTTATSHTALRRRGIVEFAADSPTATTPSNPFSDDTNVATDNETSRQTPPLNPFLYIEPALVDLTPDPTPLESSSPAPQEEQHPAASPLLTPTLTPRSNRSLSIDILSMQNSVVADGDEDDTDDAAADIRSEVFSEGGFTDAGLSEAETGVMTPSSWTEVGSDNGSEWGN